MDEPLTRRYVVYYFSSVCNWPFFAFTIEELPELLTFIMYLRTNCIRMFTFVQTSKPQSVTVRAARLINQKEPDPNVKEHSVKEHS